VGRRREAGCTCNSSHDRRCVDVHQSVPFATLDLLASSARAGPGRAAVSPGETRLVVAATGDTSRLSNALAGSRPALIAHDLAAQGVKMARRNTT
jgi:hypothetical protein